MQISPLTISAIQSAGKAQLTMVAAVTLETAQLVKNAKFEFKHYHMSIQAKTNVDVSDHVTVAKKFHSEYPSVLASYTFDAAGIEGFSRWIEHSLRGTTYIHSIQDLSRWLSGKPSGKDMRKQKEDEKRIAEKREKLRLVREAQAASANAVAPAPAPAPVSAVAEFTEDQVTSAVAEKVEGAAAAAVPEVTGTPVEVTERPDLSDGPRKLEAEELFSVDADGDIIELPTYLTAAQLRILAAGLMARAKMLETQAEAVPA
jgi:hypothetical protein